MGQTGPGSLRLIEGDALDQPLTRLVAQPYDVVANLPYHITSPILHRLLGEPPRPRRLVLMVQREVAERIAARPGGLSYLSVFVQYHATVRIVRRVPPTAFEPAPAVDSAVIAIEPFAEDDRLAPDAEDALWRLVQAAFRERRKMIHNVLTRQLPLPGERVDGRPRRGRHRARSAAADPGRRRVAAPARHARADRQRRARAAARPGRRQGRPLMSDPLNRLAPVVRLAPAKLNLTLAIVGRRPDGYHALHSIMAPLGLSDRLSLAPAAGGHDTLHVSGPGLDRVALGPPADNLVLRAIAAARRCGRRRAADAGAGGPAGEADPDRGRPGRRQQRRGGRLRRGARGLGRRR